MTIDICRYDTASIFASKYVPKSGQLGENYILTSGISAHAFFKNEPPYFSGLARGNHLNFLTTSVTGPLERREDAIIPLPNNSPVCAWDKQYLHVNETENNWKITIEVNYGWVKIRMDFPKLVD